jgi:hypothetical protein
MEIQQCDARSIRPRVHVYFGVSDASCWICIALFVVFVCNFMFFWGFARCLFGVDGGGQSGVQLRETRQVCRGKQVDEERSGASSSSSLRRLHGRSWR